jgi:hypothetical protein
MKLFSRILTASFYVLGEDVECWVLKVEEEEGEAHVVICLTTESLIGLHLSENIFRIRSSRFVIFPSL